MFSTDFIFRQQENLVDNQKCQAGFRPLCNKIPLPVFYPISLKEFWKNSHIEDMSADFLRRFRNSLRQNSPEMMHFQACKKFSN